MGHADFMGLHAGWDRAGPNHTSAVFLTQRGGIGIGTARSLYRGCRSSIMRHDGGGTSIGFIIGSYGFILWIWGCATSGYRQGHRPMDNFYLDALPEIVRVRTLSCLLRWWIVSWCRQKKKKKSTIVFECSGDGERRNVQIIVSYGFNVGKDAGRKSRASLAPIVIRPEHLARVKSSPPII